jgi:hypothetical protein
MGAIDKELAICNQALEWGYDLQKSNLHRLIGLSHTSPGAQQIEPTV